MDIIHFFKMLLMRYSCFAVKIQQFLWKIAVFLPQFLYICSRKHQIRQEIWNY